MAELFFSPEADQFLTSTEATNPILAGRIHAALDLLESDPGDSLNRRRPFSSIGMWGIPVFWKDEEWLILWEPYEDGVYVYRFIPAP